MQAVSATATAPTLKHHNNHNNTKRVGLVSSCIMTTRCGCEIGRLQTRQGPVRRHDRIILRNTRTLEAAAHTLAAAKEPTNAAATTTTIVSTIPRAPSSHPPG